MQQTFIAITPENMETQEAINTATFGYLFASIIHASSFA